jgi:hypothetical protein
MRSVTRLAAPGTALAVSAKTATEKPAAKAVAQNTGYRAFTTLDSLTHFVTLTQTLDAHADRCLERKRETPFLLGFRLRPLSRL